MLKEIKGYFLEEQVRDFVKEAERMIETYGWQEMVTHPYPNCPVKVTKIIADLKDYDQCTRGSREYLIQLANGLSRILNKWEEYELQPKIRVRILNTGKEKELREELANDMIAAGLCIAI